MLKKIGGKPARRIEQVDIDTGEVIETYENVHEAAYDNFITESMIYKAMNNSYGVVKSRGLCFRYVFE